MRMPSLVNHRMRVIPHDLFIFIFREWGISLSFANRLRPHEFLESRSGEDEREVNYFASDIRHRDPGVGGDKHSGLTVHVPRRVAKAHPGCPILQKEDLI